MARYIQNKEKYKLSEMTDEEIEKLLETVPCAEDFSTDDESDFGSDDSQNDPDWTVSGNLIKDKILTNLDDQHPTTSVARLVEETEATGASIFEQPPVMQTKTPANKRSLELQGEERDTVESIDGTFIGNVLTLNNNSEEFKKVVWKKKSLQLHKNEIAFHGNSELPVELLALKTPYEYFMYFFTESLLEKLADETNLYARQCDINTRFTTYANELRKFIGILVFMSVYRYPNVRAYWGKHSFEYIRETMPVLRFEEIRRYLHFADISCMPKKDESGFDHLYKIRPIIDHFNGRFGSIPKLQRLCVDEQMCTTKMTGTSLRQYMPNKPHKWGFKFFVLCDSTGFSYAFEVYSGAGDNIIQKGAPDLGASSNVVIRLTKDVPNFMNHIIYFDNFYTSLALLVYLRSKGIYSLGTVRVNRITNCKLSSDNHLAAKHKRHVPRGYNEEYVGNVFGVDISTVLWNDTKTVRLASTYVGVEEFASSTPEPPRKIKRWDKRNKQYQEIDCPNIIKEYNRHMGGVDLMDGLLGRYHIRMKTRKWTSRIFYHLLDVSMVNSYILYHRMERNPKIELPVFRTMVAEALCNYGATNSTKRSVGRPSNTPPQSPKPSSKRTYFPVEDIRYDKIDHWCVFRDRTGKKMCKYPGCKSETQAFCTKCNLSLCNSTARSCFYKFHNKE